VSFAGPVGTALCALVIAVTLQVLARLTMVNGTNVAFFEALTFLGYIEVFMVIINLVPVPPLDGFGILRPWLPYSIQGLAARLGMGGMVIVFLLLWYSPAGAIISDWALSLGSAIGIDPYFAYLGQQHFRLH
jgi:Zn-dependent protease